MLGRVLALASQQRINQRRALGRVGFAADLGQQVTLRLGLGVGLLAGSDLRLGQFICQRITGKTRCFILRVQILPTHGHGVASLFCGLLVFTSNRLNINLVLS